jgi:hypothetical protein
MHQLIELRGQREKKLSKALTREAVREIHKRLKRGRKDFRPEVNRDPLAVARQILEPIARADGLPSEELVHQYRILGKRARYAAEFASKSPQSVQFIAQIERIQDALGDWHDWLTLTQSAAERLGDVRESSLVAALHNVTGAKFLPGRSRRGKVAGGNDNQGALTRRRRLIPPPELETMNFPSRFAFRFRGFSEDERPRSYSPWA